MMICHCRGIDTALARRAIRSFGSVTPTTAQVMDRLDDEVGASDCGGCVENMLPQLIETEMKAVDAERAAAE